MTLTQLAPPYPIFTDRDGSPLDAGYLYFGAVNENPETNPIQIYYDSAFTIPAAQPLRTSNGYVMRNGSPALIYANSQFSVTVRNKRSELVIYSPVGFGIIPGTAATLTDQMTYDQGDPGSVLRVLTSRLQDFVSVKDFGAVGDGVTDDTAAIQAAFDSIGAITAGSYQEISPKGVTIHFPSGRYLVTSTLYMPSNVRMQGTGMGTQFKFNPTSLGSHFLKEKNDNVGGSALNRSNFSMHFENFYVFAAQDGGSTTGRNGSPTPTINTNIVDCFNLTDCAYSSFTNVTVTDFWYGTAFNLMLDTLFAYYNYMLGCTTRDCELSVQTTSACQITDSNFSHGVAYPPPSIAANVQYAVSFDGYRGCAMQGGSIECFCSVALIKQNNAGHTFTGVYMEAKAGNAMMDASSLVIDSGSLLIGGNSYGFTGNILYDENFVRSGTSAMTHGAALNFGDCSEIEIESLATRESPSFREGLPGRGHFPAGGTLTIDTDSFIGNTSMALTRGAGTAATRNTMSYNFVIKGSEKVFTNVWLTCLVKIEGGEDNFSISTFDATNSNVVFKKQMTFNNGWFLYVGYLTRVNNSTVTFSVSQNIGSTDPLRIIKVTALRAYTNGFLPIPAPYQWPEYRAAVPATGTWKRGDLVWNSQPSALGTPGWICTTAGTPGTWSAMASLV